jgi:2-polyprenyl-3-methyl-5-hydroxy-6-metoxy-1,4-benzoquinol methylase
MPHFLQTCILCGGSERQFQLHAVVKGWRYVRCGDCGLVFLHPQPTEAELGEFYDHYYRYDSQRYQNSISGQQKWLDLLEELCGIRGDLLEIGCSFGYFLQAAKNRGWNVQGVELGGDAADFAHDNLGLSVRKGRISDIRSEAMTFDAIAAWHVLEHDPFPRAFVVRAFELLRPGGILALRVPNLQSTVAKLAGPHWQWLSPPEHVCMYSEKTLSQLLSEAGFETVAKRSVRGNARNMWFEVARARMKQVVLKVSDGQEKTSQKVHFAPPTVYQDRLWYRTVENIFSTLSWPLDELLSPWMERHNSDAELVLFARKPGMSDRLESSYSVNSKGCTA